MSRKRSRHAKKKTRRLSNSSRFPVKGGAKDKATASPPKKSSVCFLTVTPSPSLIAFASRLAEFHTVYILCDDSSAVQPTTDAITCLQVSEEECEKASFIHANPALPKTPAAWDKALYYFSVVAVQEGPVWLIEDDVFIPRPNILAEIDADTVGADLVVGEDRSKDACSGWMWWDHAAERLDTPLYSGMVCAVRISPALFQTVNEYARKKKTLCFIEYMFHTLSHGAGHRVQTDTRLLPITHREEWNETNIDTNHLFHPVKDLALQDRLHAAIDGGATYEPVTYKGSLQSDLCLKRL